MKKSFKTVLITTDTSSLQGFETSLLIPTLKSIWNNIARVQICNDFNNYNTDNKHLLSLLNHNML